MHVKKLLGILAMVFGTIGFLAGVICVVGVWPAAFYVNTKAEEVFDSGDIILKSISKKVGQVDKIVDKITTPLKEVRSSAEAVAEKGEDSDPEDLAKMQAVTKKVSNSLQKAENLVEVFHAGIAGLENLYKVAKMLPIVSSNNSTLDPEILKNIKATSEFLNSATTSLEEVVVKIEEIREKKNVQANAKALLALTENLNTKVDSISTHTANAKDRLSAAEEQLSTFRNEVSFWCSVGPLILSFVFLWISIGQWSLLVHGRSMISAPQGNE